MGQQILPKLSYFPARLQDTKPGKKNLILQTLSQLHILYLIEQINCRDFLCLASGKFAVERELRVFQCDYKIKTSG
jgi:hypothetical protein